MDCLHYQWGLPHLPISLAPEEEGSLSKVDNAARADSFLRIEVTSDDGEKGYLLVHLPLGMP